MVNADGIVVKPLTIAALHISAEVMWLVIVAVFELLTTVFLTPALCNSKIVRLYQFSSSLAMVIYV